MIWLLRNNPTESRRAHRIHHIHDLHTHATHDKRARALTHKLAKFIFQLSFETPGALTRDDEPLRALVQYALASVFVPGCQAVDVTRANNLSGSSVTTSTTNARQRHGRVVHTHTLTRLRSARNMRSALPKIMSVLNSKGTSTHQHSAVSAHEFVPSFVHWRIGSRPQSNSDDSCFVRIYARCLSWHSGYCNRIWTRS